MRSPIVCLEGPSAVGKTSLAHRLAECVGAAVVAELDPTSAPAPAMSTTWFADRHSARWRQALAMAREAPLVVVDGDPFKGLWFNWIFAQAGWPAIEDAATACHARVASGELAFPDLYVVLTASEDELRRRKQADGTRRRRHFDEHLRLIAPQRSYFMQLATLDPSRVLFIDTSSQHDLVDRVVQAAGVRPADDEAVLSRMTEFVLATTAFP